MTSKIDSRALQSSHPGEQFGVDPALPRIMQPALVAKPAQPTGDPLGPEGAGIEAEGDGGAPSGNVIPAKNSRSARVKWPRLRLNTYLLASTSRAGVQVFSLLGVLLAVSSIDIATFGAYSVAWVSAVISNTLIYTGFYHYLLRCVDVDRERHTVFWVILALGFLFAGGMAAVGHFLSADGGGCLVYFFSSTRRFLSSLLRPRGVTLYLFVMVALQQSE